MEEQQIDPEPLIAYSQAPLAPDKGEIAAELQQEAFQALDQGPFQIVLRILILQIEKFKDKGVFDLVFRRCRVFRDLISATHEHGFLVPR